MNDSNTCICCGEYTPEDRMVCKKCEKKYLDDSKNNS